MNQFDVLGYNLRISDIQAAVGVAQMEKLESILSERKRIAALYQDALSEVSEIVVPNEIGKCGHTFQSFVVRIVSGCRETRNKVMLELAEQGMQTRPGTHAVHRLGYYSNKYNIPAERFPNACLGEDATITLPLFVGMSEDDVNHVASTLQSSFVD